MNAFKPNWASKPGNTILDILREKGMSKEEFVNKMNKPADQVYGLIYGDSIICDKVAAQLSTVLGASKQFWLNRQKQYEESLLFINKLDEKQWLRDMPLNEITSLGWVKNSQNKLEACLNFFDVKSLSEWIAIYNARIGGSISFRTSSSFNSKIGPLTCWLRRGEIVGDNTECNNWDAQKFEKSLVNVKALIKEKNPEKFIPKLKSICAESGVVVAIVKAPKGCRASGATSFISMNKALIILSFRHLSDDHFWFTFFHEAGHLLLHKNKAFRVEGLDQNESVKINAREEDQEEEANNFASQWLVKKELHDRMSKLKGNTRAIVSFAMEAGVSPGIVVGQMQHFDYIRKDYLNGYKRRYTWDQIQQILD